jgi:hypothetical protein
MSAFVINLENRPGSLTRVAEALGSAGVNITAIAGATSGGQGVIGLTVDDESGARSALDGAGLSYDTVELAMVSLEDRPGGLAEAARRLSDAGVNVELLLVTGRDGPNVTVAFGVADPATARSALGDLAG